MRILIFNWRDIKNPTSGGAEILTHEMAKRLVKLGHGVTQFSSSFENCLPEESIDGVRIIRRGYPDARYFLKSVHFLAFWHYQTEFKGKFDLVIDEIHGFPFFTPWYVKEKKIVLICEVADQLWNKMFGQFFGIMGRVIELFYLHLVYKNILYFTISHSTKNDLINHGVNKKNIKVLPMGITIPDKIKLFNKEKIPTLLFVGRLSKSKGIEDALFAMEKLHKLNSNSKLWIVGRGNKEYVDYLKELSRKLKISDNTIFFDFVDERKKFELMSKAHILISLSIKEGFGLTIPEAGFVGTPSIVYNSPGLSEVVLNNKTGLICRTNSLEELTKNINKLIRDKALYRKLAKNAFLESKKYNWEKTIIYFAKAINAL